MALRHATLIATHHLRGDGACNYEGKIKGDCSSTKGGFHHFTQCRRNDDIFSF
jgi:hypothetical protein